MFLPLQTYFEAGDDCPVSIQRFFADTHSLFWLHFIDGQLSLSNKYVLKTETKKSAAFEVAAMIKELRDVVGARAQQKFIPVSARELLEEFSQVQKTAVMKYVSSFYKELVTYLEKWSQSLDGTEIFGWMNLTCVPDWENDVEPSLNYAIAHGASQIDADAVFDELQLIKQVVEKELPSWTEKGTSSESRWLQIFQTMNEEHRPIKDLTLLVEFAFAIPGTSTEVERLFSTINNVWTLEKDSMSHPSLEAHLSVSYNSSLDCIAYFESVKNNQSMLAKVQSNDKYVAGTSTATGPADDEDDEDVIML